MKPIALLTAVVLLALGGVAWWYSLSGTLWQAALTRAIVRQEPRIRMEKFSLRDSQRQQPRWEILADVAELDPKANTTSIEGVHITLFSATRGTVQVTSRRGVIHNQSKDMQVCGDVHLVMGEEFSLTTECLQWFAAQEMLVADTPVTIERGAFQVQGQGFRGWIAEERFEVVTQVLARWSEP
jgi:LPS export ABC transporter protein LptC